MDGSDEMLVRREGGRGGGGRRGVYGHGEKIERERVQEFRGREINVGNGLTVYCWPCRPLLFRYHRLHSPTSTKEDGPCG